jgi:four helix bundle protein
LVFHVSISKLEVETQCKVEKGECRMENKTDLKERTKKFALRIIKMYSSLPKSMEAKVLGTQVLRSGTLVGANYREASQGRSKAEFVAKMGDCLKELEETIYWFDLLIEGNILAKNKLSGLLQESKELTAIFVTIIKKTKNNQGKK